MPTNEQIDKALELIAQGYAVYDYFFAKLNDPDWIAPLKEKSLFSDPPQALRNDEGEIFGASWWPQSKYLARMAGEAPKEVLCVALAIRTDNYFVMSDFTEAAIQMPSNFSSQWAKRIIKWLNEGNNPFGVLEDGLGKLASKLAREGDAKTALALIAELLAVSPDPELDKKQHPENMAEEISYSSLNPLIRCDEYHYQQILEKTIPEIAQVAPEGTIALLCDLLSKAVEYSLSSPEKPYDMSSITRPAIESHDQNQHHGLDFTSNLITTLRNVAEKYCGEHPGKLSEVINTLESYEWDIFRRMALHLLRVINPAPMNLVQERLVNDEYFDYTPIHHEYFHLLKRRFKNLPSEQQQIILEWIDKAESCKNRLNDSLEKYNNTQIESIIRNWQYRKLAAIKDDLIGDWKQRFQNLEAEFTAKESTDSEMPPDFHFWTGGTWIGPRSPKETSELKRMSKSELIQYLKGWKPSGKMLAPTPEGLGAELENLVAENPLEYTGEIERFMDDNIEPTYIKHLIRGFCRAAEADIRIPHELILKLCKWVVDKPNEILDRKILGQMREEFDIDADWRNAKREITRLFEKIFMDNMELPYELRTDVWHILEPLTRNPEPDKDYERQYADGTMDALTISINTIRGKALHCVMHYAMWVCRRIKDDLKKRENRAPALVDLPEVQVVLENHLDITKPYGEMLTDRAVYGHWLPQISWLDANWFAAHLGTILPPDPTKRSLRMAAWRSYLMYSGKLYKTLTRLIRNIYADEVEMLAEIKVENDAEKALGKRLVEHIVIFYTWGDTTLEKDDIAERLFRVAPPDLTGHAMDFLGRNLSGKIHFEPQMIQRLRDLWEWRVETCGGAKKMPEQELSAFGWWFSCGKFDPAWALNHLESVLKITGFRNSSIYVLEYMQTIFTSHPIETLRCLRLLIERTNEPYFLYSERHQKIVVEILRQGIQHQDKTIKDESENIVHLLGSKGCIQYRELLVNT